MGEVELPRRRESHVVMERQRVSMVYKTWLYFEKFIGDPLTRVIPI